MPYAVNFSRNQEECMRRSKEKLNETQHRRVECSAEQLNAYGATRSANTTVETDDNCRLSNTVRTPRSKLSNTKIVNENYEEHSWVMKQIPVKVRERNILEQEMSEAMALSFADSKVVKESSHELDNTDIFDDLCAKSPVKSLIKFYEISSRKEWASKTPRKDDSNSPVARRRNRRTTITKIEVSSPKPDMRIDIQKPVEERSDPQRMANEKEMCMKISKEKMNETQLHRLECPDEHLNTCSANQSVCMIQARELYKRYKENCKKLMDENCRLSNTVKSLRYQLSLQKVLNETCEENCFEMKQETLAEVGGREILEQEMSEAMALSCADNKIDKDTSLEWDYTDIFDDLCATRKCDSTTDIIPRVPQTASKFDELQGIIKDLQICLRRKEYKLSEMEEYAGFLKEKLRKMKVDMDKKRREIVNLNNKIDSMTLN